MSPAFVYEPKVGRWGGGGCGVSANEYSCAVCTWSPSKRWRAYSITYADWRSPRIGDAASFLVWLSAIVVADSEFPSMFRILIYGSRHKLKTLKSFIFVKKGIFIFTIQTLLLVWRWRKHFFSNQFYYLLACNDINIFNKSVLSSTVLACNNINIFSNQFYPLLASNDINSFFKSVLFSISNDIISDIIT